MCRNLHFVWNPSQGIYRSPCVGCWQRAASAKPETWSARQWMWTRLSFRTLRSTLWCRRLPSNRRTAAGAALPTCSDTRTCGRSPSSYSSTGKLGLSVLTTDSTGSLTCFYVFRFVNNSTYYGLSWSTSSLGGNTYLIFFISGLVEFPAYAFLLLTLDKWGRRKILSYSMIVASVGLILTAIIPQGMLILNVSDLFNIEMKLQVRMKQFQANLSNKQFSGSVTDSYQMTMASPGCRTVVQTWDNYPGWTWQLSISILKL